ncbi:restriction endonuclease subunit S [Macrococcoides caseolyticum]|uniref:restriction endonuclease subunit S n=1 Tax=Macrococcoides caseolyticum TaxID=69966 RepID=UPI000C3288D3|nr:restriction endonuclease subunit S [Macrococcus caseolyticus]PKE49864.1 restriction endonuclease subunit S [Macrococcus caseolyticus]
MKTDESKFHFILKDYSLYYEKFQDGTVKSIQDEIPFEVPEGWEWVRLINFAKEIKAGGDKPLDISYTKDNNYKYPVFSNGVKNDGLYGYTTKPIVNEPAITISARGTIGYSVIREPNFFPIIRLIFITFHEIYSDIYFLNFIFKVLIPKKEGTSIPQLTVPNMKDKLIPIPPLKEQIRIKERVENALNEISKIEEIQYENIKLLKNIKNKTLSLAMQGKLVPQDPKDEPASVLLEKIKEEKEKLILEGKIKRNKKESTILRRGESYYELLDGEEKDITDEIPYSIPSNWEWTKLNYIFEVTSSKRVFKHEWTTEGIPFYRAREIVKFNKNEKLIDPIFISNTTYLEKKRISGIPCINDLLITGVGTIGVPYIVTDDEPFYFKDGNIIWLKNIYNINPKFIFYLFDSIKFKHLLSIGSNKTTVDTLTITRANELYIPLPSLREQIRIVKKLEAIQNV